MRPLTAILILMAMICLCNSLDVQNKNEKTGEEEEEEDANDDDDDDDDDSDNDETDENLDDDDDSDDDDSDDDSEDKDGFRRNCDCKHCHVERVIGLGERNITNDDNKTHLHAHPTVCAYDHDLGNRTFRSVCDMHCHNKCTRFSLVKAGKNITRYEVHAFRTNYYKLADGEC